MSSPQDDQGGPQEPGTSDSGRPPYAPRIASLGGLPDVLPDIPITAAFLALYVLFAIIHMSILRRNKKRDHKFLFSGALFGFCKIRIVTMSLRIAWACYDRNISLGIAATIFVYVGTIILYIINWFFAQRIVRAQHPRFGWSLSYRILHRGGLVFLVASLLMLIVGSIQQFFTQGPRIITIDRYMTLAGQTYFSAFCFAPILITFLSLIVPRKGTEKFGAGRLRNNITVLIIAAAILSVGQIFRCVTAWLPPVPLRGPQGTPWYFSRTCFYVFNFATEILVVIFYAVVRVDLRFHVPNGANGRGAYAKGRHDSRYNIGLIGDEKNLKRASTQPYGKMRHNNGSNETLHEYDNSLFDDSRTLADSLRYPSSVLEVDSKTGHWKIKRASSIHSGITSHGSEPSLWSPDRDTYVNKDAPPIPPIPTDWPLRESQLSRSAAPVMEHSNKKKIRAHSSSFGSEELPGHGMNRIDMGDAIAEAIAKLEANSEANKTKPNGLGTAAPPDYDAITPVNNRSQPNLPLKKAYIPDMIPGSDIPRKHLYSPNPITVASASTSTSDVAGKHKSAPASDLPKKHVSSPAGSTVVPKPLRFNRVSTASAVSASSDRSRRQDFTPPMPGSREAMSPARSLASRSVDTEEAAAQAFERFSYEAPPREGEAGYDGGSLTDEEKDFLARSRDY